MRREVEGGGDVNGITCEDQLRARILSSGASVRFKTGGVKFDVDLTICELEGVDVVLGNTFLHYYEVEVRQMPNVHLVTVGSDGKPKSLPFTRLTGLDGLGINLVTKEALFEEQFVLIPNEKFFDNNSKGLLPHSFIINIYEVIILLLPFTWLLCVLF